MIREQSFLVELVPRDPLRVDSTRPSPSCSTSTPMSAASFEHRLDVGDRRDVRERDRLVRQNARRDDRQRRVLVPGDPNRPAERPPALDDERLAEGDCDSHASHATRIPHRFQANGGLC